MRPVRSRSAAIWIWAALTALVGAVTVWVLAHGYLNDAALFRWAQISTTLSAPELRLENLGLLYPHVPIYLLAPFYFLPGLASPFAPYIASTVIGATLLAVWFHHLRQRRYSTGAAALMVLLVAVHPLFLWVTTSGTEKALSLLTFYLLCVACVRLLRIGDVRSIIMLGGLLALYFFVDERTIFLFLALLPMLVFLAPLRMLHTSLASAYLLISLPIVVSVLAWIYLNWLFHGDPWLFLTSAESAFVGVSREVEHVRWLRVYGGDFFRPLGAATVLALITLPVLGWALWQLRTRRRVLLGISVLSLHPILATALASKTFFLEHAFEMLFLMIAGSMAALLMLPKVWARRPTVPVLWLFAAVVGGWITFGASPDDELRLWRTAISGDSQNEAYAADARVGQWLAENRSTTLIDSRSAYRVVVAYGEPQGLLLPFMPEFKLAERLGQIQAEQVVVIDPAHQLALRDRITQAFPTLYEGGQSGYTLALDDPPWRVYKRNDAPRVAR